MVGFSRRKFLALALSGVGVSAGGVGYCSQEGCTSLRNSNSSDRGPDQTWRLAGIEAPAFTRRSDMAVGDERLFVTTDTGISYINKGSGNGIKNRGLGPNVTASFQYLEVVGENLFAASGGRAVNNRGWALLDPDDDDQYRLVNWGTEWEPTLTAGFDGSRLFVGGENHLGAFDLETDKRLWSKELPARGGFAAGADRVFITVNGDNGGINGLLMINAATGTVIEEETFIVPTERSLSAPAFRSGTVYVADRQTIYAISATGTGRWQYTLSNAEFDRGQPIRFRDGRLVAGGRRGIAVLNPATGEREWTRSYTEPIVEWSATDSTVFTLHGASGIRDTVTGTKTIIHAYELTSGEHLGWYALDTRVQRADSGSNTLYVITEDDEIIALQT